MSCVYLFFFFKQKTAYEMRISDWSSDVCSSDLPGALRGYRSDDELRYLVGPGVSAAAVWRMRECLDREGFHKVKIVVSSGFGPAKCRLMAEAKAPIDVVGTGSYLPRSEEHTSELQSLMRISYAVFCLKQNK